MRSCWIKIITLGIVLMPCLAAAMDKETAYRSALEEMQSMLEKGKPDFKKAVFLTENAYYGQGLSYDDFLSDIGRLKAICNAWIKANRLKSYNAVDSADVLKNYAIHSVLKDTVFLIGGVPISLPFTYDFVDFEGKKDWPNMFVSKLLKQHKGNCHSLPYLYKILAEELNTPAWLSLAPSHIYIKNRCKKLGWYNTELTSGQFPTDAWIKASGYISLDAIRSGIYMDTVSRRQSIALCIYDLAKGYERQTAANDGEFILQCCNLALAHYPNHINSIILKAETLKKRFEAMMIARGAKSPAEILHAADAKKLFDEMEECYIRTVTLGYYEMPAEMYLDWLTSLKNQQEKYSDPKTNSIFK